MSEIQAKLFNGCLAWDNNNLEWSHLYEVKDQQREPVEVLQLLIADGQLVLELGYES